MAQFTPIDPASDVVSTTTKVTTGYFSGGRGELAGSNFATKSLAGTQDKFYYNVQFNSEDQFSLAFGNQVGSGSDFTTNVKGETESVYKAYSSMLLPNDDVQTGFVMVDGTNGTNEVTQSSIYVVAAERLRMKDRVNRKNWTFTLSGSTSAGATSGSTIKLTDDSNALAAVPTPMGPRFNIVSGSSGTVHTPAATKTYGHFYPNVGLFIMSANSLSDSLGGHHEYLAEDAKTLQAGAFTNATGSGLAPDLRVSGSADNAAKLFVAFQKGTVALRGEEDQMTSDFFIRAKAPEFNFSLNPTFASGSTNKIRHSSMIGNPQTFITEVGLYNDASELLAVGKLSAPVNKNYGTEATIKVKLTY